MNKYYPLKRVRDKLNGEQMTATPTDKKGWSYTFTSNDGQFIVETNCHHSITNVSFTHNKYKGLGMSLKRAQTKWMKVCRYLGSIS